MERYRSQNEITCAAPFCNARLAKAEADKRGWGEWMCSAHWAFVSRKTKGLRRKIRAQIAKQGRTEPLMRMDRWTWEAAKRQAIEGAAGIG